MENYTLEAVPDREVTLTTDALYDIKMDLQAIPLDKPTQDSEWQKSLKLVDKFLLAADVGVIGFFLFENGIGNWVWGELAPFTPLLIPQLYFVARWLGFLPNDAPYGLTITKKEISWKMAVLGKRKKVAIKDIESVYIPLDGLHLQLKNGKKKEIEFTSIGMDTVNEELKPNIRNAFESLGIPVHSNY